MGRARSTDGGGVSSPRPRPNGRDGAPGFHGSLQTPTEFLAVDQPERGGLAGQRHFTRRSSICPPPECREDRLSSGETMQQSGSGAAGVFVAFIFLVALGLYFLPTIIALLRRAPDRGAVIVLNLFLGWTLIG